ncbi:MAG: LON peptidase substrate-binding domain-containing protein [Acidimicrobiia bacterium]
MSTRTLPMFPLGSVLFPYAALPLHVFEDRYRALVEHCLTADGEPEFGVVLIERGSEVGGGDTRFDVGTIARIVDVGQFPDGRYALVTVGTSRLRVAEWLPDDPYPRAEVDVVEEIAAPAEAATARSVVEEQLRRVLALASELGAAVPPVDVRLDDDPVRAAFEACALAPIGSLDAQRLLALDDPLERLTRLVELLADTAELLELRLGEP